MTRPLQPTISGGIYANYNRGYPILVTATGSGFAGESRVFDTTGLGNWRRGSWDQYGSWVQSGCGKITDPGRNGYRLYFETGRHNVGLDRGRSERAALWHRVPARWHGHGRKA